MTLEAANIPPPREQAPGTSGVAGEFGGRGLGGGGADEPSGEGIERTVITIDRGSPVAASKISEFLRLNPDLSLSVHHLYFAPGERADSSDERVVESDEVTLEEALRKIQDIVDVSRQGAIYVLLIGLVDPSDREALTLLQLPGQEKLIAQQFRTRIRIVHLISGRDQPEFAHAELTIEYDRPGAPYRTEVAGKLRNLILTGKSEEPRAS